MHANSYAIVCGVSTLVLVGTFPMPFFLHQAECWAGG